MTMECQCGDTFGNRLWEGRCLFLLGLFRHDYFLFSRRYVRKRFFQSLFLLNYCLRCFYNRNFRNFCNHRFSISSLDYLFQFGNFVQFLGSEIQVPFDAQSVYLDFLHFVKRHIAQLPAVTHRHGTEADTSLGVVLQEISRICSHRKEIACVGDLITNEFLLRAIQFGKLLSDTVRHQVIGIICLFVRFWLLLGQINHYAQFA